MSKLSRDDVLKLAALSKLRLTEQEIEKFREDLSEILGYVEVLNSVNTAGLEPTYQLTGLKNISRPDEIKDYDITPVELLANAPSVQDGQFKVKRVL